MAQSQNDQILKYLQRGRVLTPLQALDKFGCLRLAARIKDLRDEGHTIHTSIISAKGKQFAGYWMSDDG